MLHCEKEVFISDDYCGECGEVLENNLSLKTIEEIDSGILSELKSLYKSAYIITGEVVSSYYYKRKYKDKENNLIFSYWWLTILDKSGAIVKISLEAKSFDNENIQKGDVITLLKPRLFTLAYKICDKKDKLIVTNNEIAMCFVTYKDEFQNAILHPDLKPEKPVPTIWIFLSIATFLGTFLGTFFYNGISDENALNALIISVLATISFGIIELLINKESYDLKVSQYETIKKTIKNIGNISLEQLGYNTFSREKSESDVICFQCKCRINSGIEFCYLCGNKQNHILNLESNSESAILNIPLKVADIENDLKQTYYLNYTSSYIHKNVLVFNDKGKINHQCILSKVIEKNVNDYVSDQTIITETTTNYETRNDRGDFRGSRNEVSTKSKRTRTTNLYGSLLLESHNNKNHTLHLSEQILGSTDVGDWLIYASSTVLMDDSADNYDELVINLSKNKYYKTDTVLNYDYKSGVVFMILLLLLSVGLTFFIEPSKYLPLLSYQEDIKYLPLAIFTIFAFGVKVMSSIYAASNKKRLKNSLGKLKNHIDLFKKNKGEIMGEIKNIE